MKTREVVNNSLNRVTKQWNCSQTNERFLVKVSAMVFLAKIIATIRFLSHKTRESMIVNCEDVLEQFVACCFHKFSYTHIQICLRITGFCPGQRVSQYQKKHSPTHTYHSHLTILNSALWSATSFSLWTRSHFHATYYFAHNCCTISLSLAHTHTILRPSWILSDYLGEPAPES